MTTRTGRTCRGARPARFGWRIGRRTGPEAGRPRISRQHLLECLGLLGSLGGILPGSAKESISERRRHGGHPGDVGRRRWPGPLVRSGPSACGGYEIRTREGLPPNTLSNSPRHRPGGYVTVLTCGEASLGSSTGPQRTTVNETRTETTSRPGPLSRRCSQVAIMILRPRVADRASQGDCASVGATRQRLTQAAGRRLWNTGSGRRGFLDLRQWPVGEVPEYPREDPPPLGRVAPPGWSSCSAANRLRAVEPASGKR